MKILSINNAKETLYYLRKEQERRENYFWKTKSGNLINIQDMTDKH